DSNGGKSWPEKMEPVQVSGPCPTGAVGSGAPCPNPDQYYGLPSTYTFTVGTSKDNGQHVFKMMLRKAGSRVVKIMQNNRATLNGSITLNIQPGLASQVQVIADYPAGQDEDPGVTTPGSAGR